MIVYKEEKKKLVIPSGFVMIPIDCDEAIEQAREDGYREGFADGSSAACDTEEGTYSLTDDFDGEETVFPSEGKTGFNKIVIVDDGYGDAKYDEGYADGIAECSGSTCNIQPLKSVMPQFDNYPVDYQMDIYPDTGYDGLGRVSIDKRPLYEQGYQAGLADCSGSSCTLEEGELDISDFWGGGPTVVYPSTADGFSQFTVEDTNGSYAHKHYMDGYNDGLAQCSGSTDCSSAVTEAYQSGYTEGYNEGYDDALYEKCDLETTLIVVPSGSTGIMNDITPAEGAGFGSVSVNATEYGEWKYQSGYTEGYNQGQAECPECDCSSAITEAYQSGYTQGQADCDCTESYQIGYQDGYADGRESVTSGCPMQEKFINLSTIEESVTPDYGYAGLSGVHINAENFYNTAYNDGYAAGLEDCSGSTDCSSAITEAYESGYTEGYNAADTKIYSSSKDVYFDELAWVDVENSTAYGEEDTIMIDYKWGNTVTGSNTIVLFSNESYDPAAANPPSPTTPSFSILLNTAGLTVTTDDGQGNRNLWTGLYRSAQLNHSYRLIVQTYSYTSSVTIKAALIDLTSGQITTGSTNTAFHFTGATSLNYCINGYRNTVDGVYQGMNTDWYLGGIKIFDNTGVMKHNYHFLNGCISDVVNDLETGYEAKYYDGAVETTYPLEGVEETMRFFY